MGALAGVGYVVFAIRESAWCWPCGILSALAYVVLFQQARLPGQSALQAALGAVCVYGWWSWRRGASAAGALSISRARPGALAAVAGLTAIAAAAAGLLLSRETESVAPFVDGGIVAASLAAQWMAARKWLENWLVWVAVNVASIALFLSQGLWLTTLLYAVYLGMAFAGYRAWTRSLERRP
jgi:nicotinamide mononucleotide transporter